MSECGGVESGEWRVESGEWRVESGDSGSVVGGNCIAEVPRLLGKVCSAGLDAKLMGSWDFPSSGSSALTAKFTLHKVL